MTEPPSPEMIPGQQGEAITEVMNLSAWTRQRPGVSLLRSVDEPCLRIGAVRCLATYLKESVAGTTPTATVPTRRTRRPPRAATMPMKGCASDLRIRWSRLSELNRRPIELDLTTLSVVPDLEVLKDRVGRSSPSVRVRDTRQGLCRLRTRGRLPRGSKVRASTASPSHWPEGACSTITEATPTRNREPPWPEGNSSANNSSGSNRWHCSASNANTVPGLS